MDFFDFWSPEPIGVTEWVQSMSQETSNHASQVLVVPRLSVSSPKHITASVSQWFYGCGCNIGFHVLLIVYVMSDREVALESLCHLVIVQEVGSAGDSRFSGIWPSNYDKAFVNYGKLVSVQPIRHRRFVRLHIICDAWGFGGPLHFTQKLPWEIQ